MIDRPAERAPGRLARRDRRRRPQRIVPSRDQPLSHTGSLRRLSELAAGDPLFLNFYRGFWWPKEQQAFYRGLRDSKTRRSVTYTWFVSVSIDLPEVRAASFSLSSTPAGRSYVGRRAALPVAELGLRETTDTVQRPLPARLVPAVPDLSIHRVWNDYWF